MSYKNTNSYKCFMSSKYNCIKYTNYFQAYDQLFNQYIGKKITFVEIGIFSGGSLFMWRKFFGKKARIIGIDLDPKAKQFEKYGFEIFIGDQSKKEFWNKFFKKVGKVDVILDDGGHTNYQQIMTTNLCVPMIKDDGKLVIEDVHTSFIKKNWYNPSKYSFINYSKFLIDDINGRIFDKTHQDTKYIGVTKKNSLNKTIYSIKFFNNFVAFFIDRKKMYRI